MRWTWRRWYGWVGVGAVVLAAGGAVALRPRSAAAPTFETAEVERGDVVAKVTASGTVSARRTVLVSSQVSGRVVEVLADYNAVVRKGEVLARLDPVPLRAAVARARANAASAQASLAKARAVAADQERQAVRRSALRDRGLLAQEEWESSQAAVAEARADVAAAEASVAQAAAALDTARYDEANGVIRAPIDGLVVSRSVEDGQTVAASLSAPTLFTLAEDLRLMQVEAHVSEGDVGRVDLGTPATFTVDAWPSLRMEGRVRQVRNAATTTSSVVTYDVVLDVENPDLKLRPGMTANVTFVVAERRGVLRVSAAALRFKPPTPPAPPPGAVVPASATAGAAAGRDARTLWVLEGERLRPVSVKAGVTDGTHTEIEGDVAPGARVAVRTTGGAAAPASTAQRSSTGQKSAPPGPPRMF